MLLPPEFAQQCCDASSYLANAMHCAQNGFCYDNLRPIGSTLWFAIPFFLGIAPEWMLLPQGFLVLLSSYLAYRWLKPATASIATASILWVCLLAIHAVFFMPVLPYSLTDAPAGAFFLIGIWLLAIADRRPGWIIYGLAGLSLGLAPFMRAAYLYPVLASLPVVFAMACIYKKLDRRQWALACLFIPLMVQTVSTWKHTQQWSFIDPSQQEDMLRIHLTDPVKGYDTFIMDGAFRWTSACWPEGKKRVSRVTEYTPSEFSCLLIDKMYFYTGSYARLNYLNNGVVTDQLYRYRGNDNYWTKLISLKQVGFDTKSGTTELAVTSSRPVLVAQTSNILSTLRPYTLHTTLWSNRPHTTNLALISKTSRKVIAHQIIELGTEPQPFSISTTLPEADRILVQLGYMGGQPTTLGSQPDDRLWHRDTRLTDTDAPDPVVHRHWSSGFLAANILAVLLALFVFIKQRWWKTPGRLFIAISGAMIFTQALVIVPEQRFVIAPMVIAWTMALSAFASRPGKSLTPEPAASA